MENGYPVEQKKLGTTGLPGTDVWGWSRLFREGETIGTLASTLPTYSTRFKCTLCFYVLQVPCASHYDRSTQERSVRARTRSARPATALADAEANVRWSFEAVLQCNWWVFWFRMISILSKFKTSTFFLF